MTTRWARLARAVVAAALSLFVAAFSHVLVGGAAPSGLAIVASFTVSVMVCVALTGKRLSLAALSIAVGVSQFLFHAVFSVWAEAAPSTAIGTGHMAAMQMGTLSPAVGHQVMEMDGWMWLGHAAAAVVTIVALRHGELAFWGILLLSGLWIGSLFSRLPKPQAPASVRPVFVQPARVFAPRGLAILLTSLRHRGPPVPVVSRSAGLA
jgi:hypothetical protein